ncbi:MAG: hypothetical protein ACD_49C00074G0019 [uncultured bacterium (gcode 4)]|uniref:Uncharacterized protein n=1 Tax=uncultured bacterium (gcode 4) TaxID=1234023 RepID=K2AVP7_9BACT|nr:MAG: hypothetical protein ACD_49C00074G0019 [uncultured bacterium (gcode 4)]
MTTEENKNQLFLDLASVHPLTVFDEVDFIDLLEHSLSLNVFEKKRVIDSIPNLSQFQIDELVKVFVDEREEFKKLLSTEAEAIKELVVKQKEWWEQLKDMYIQENLKKSSEWEDQAKIDDLKSSLWL